MVISEMVASEALTVGQQEMRLKAESAGLPTHIVQLSGREVKWMKEATKVAEQSNASVVDINMGCPSKRVTNGYSGSALMRDLDHALRLIDAVLDSTDLPVTLKMRLGWDETSINAPELAERAVQAGVKLITVHGRTRNQFYKGKADWLKVAQVRERISVPLIVNGDISNINDAKLAMIASLADGVMIGRASYGAPWLPGQIGAALNGEPIQSTPHGHQMVSLISSHYEAMLSFYGPALGIRNARKHLGWYCEHLPASQDYNGQRLAMMKSENPAEVLRIIHSIFADVPLQQVAA